MNSVARAVCGGLGSFPLEEGRLGSHAPIMVLGRRRKQVVSAFLSPLHIGNGDGCLEVLATKLPLQVVPVPYPLSGGMY